MHHTLPRLGALLAICVVTACHDTTKPQACGTLDVTVTAPTTTPVISWTPATCLVTDVTVFDPALNTMWHTYVTLSDTLIPPPVTYGDTPPSGHVAVAAKTLVAGQTYTVDLLWQGGSVTYGGSTTFVH